MFSLLFGWYSSNTQVLFIKTCLRYKCLATNIFSRMHARTRLYNPLCPSVGPHFTFFMIFNSLTSLLLPKWSSDLKYGPCPPTCDFGSCVSALVLLRIFLCLANAGMFNVAVIKFSVPLLSLLLCLCLWKLSFSLRFWWNRFLGIKFTDWLMVSDASLVWW